MEYSSHLSRVDTPILALATFASHWLEQLWLTVAAAMLNDEHLSSTWLIV